ncbi:amidohydrolase family protein [Sphingomonas sp. S1-29]|uniref:amidohydrolase family protein n=1 Tax=Sphingomonas sp. S1-29 TaxID=2991074 RepID=UPI00223EB11E|nr:amidohydrolase family protein [Sphingomonas sp. S1-29]UZK70991.1 amidohydrolase family protein [Sphingomonas sp. S1-29]
MRDLPLVDAHAHLLELGRLHYGWLQPPFSDSGPNGNVAAIARDHVLAAYRAEAANWNVVGMVHVEAGADQAQKLDETAWVEQTAAAEGMPNAIVAYAALDDPDIERVLAAQAAFPRVRGIRHIVNWHRDAARTYTPRDITQDDAWVRGFGLLARHGLSFDLHAYPHQFAGLSRLIERHPEVSVIVNHAGMGVGADKLGKANWRAGMRALAALPNVAVKVSGIGFVQRPWNLEMVRDRARETIDLFGSNRAMIASNFPTDRLVAPFDDTMGALADVVAEFTDCERRALFARNANRIYRLGLNV